VTDDSLEAGRDAIARHAWKDAFDLLSAADASSSLAAEDLERLGDAAFWIGRARDCIRFRERSAAAYTQTGDRRGAARVSLALAGSHFSQRSLSVGAGWFAKAQRLLADEAEAPEHGELAIWKAQILIARGDLDGALAAARNAFEVGRRFANPDLQAHGLSLEGSILIRQGNVAQGMALIDESMTAAVGGELGPVATASIYCTTISACHRIGDYRRAAEWTEAAEGCAVRPGMADFPGDCRAHRVGILRMHGTWTDAEREAEQASQVESFDRGHVGMALYEIGEIRLRRGDLAAAEEVFRRAEDMGKTPQPGLSLLRLARGKIEAAASSIAGALADESWDRLARARLLPAAIEIAVAAGNAKGARAAADELAGIAETYGTAAHEAASCCALGLVLLAEGDATAAASRLRRGWRLWKEVEAPYEVARARMALAEALRAQGDREGCAAEARAALSTFERLGTLPDVERANRLLEDLEKVSAAREATERRLVRTFMFTDIVGSTSLLEAIGDEAWAALLRWHDQALRAQFAAHRGEEIDHAGDGFFVAFVDVESAIACALAIQRALAKHRQSHGFSPQVRIGVHASEATSQGTGYHGKGVHRAARIGALAEGGEILVSEETLATVATSFETSAPRTVTLKGMSEPATVVAVLWR
jgi:class 3 adenylate cyclase